MSGPAGARPWAGMALAALGTFFLVVQDAVSKHLADTLAPEQIMAWRGLFSLPLIVALAVALGRSGALVVPVRPGIVLLRGALAFATSALIVVAVAHVPFAEAMAVLQLAPFLILVLARPLLGERAGPTGYLAVAIGFAGALLVLRPGAGLGLAALAPFAAAFAAALQDIVTRAAARRDGVVTILFWSMLVATLAGFGWAAFTTGWAPPDRRSLAWLAGAAVLASLAYYCVIAALERAGPARLAPLRYSAIAWGVAIGYLGWGERPDLLALAGMALIAAAGLGALRRRDED